MSALLVGQSYLKNTLVHATMPDVYRAVNLMQATPWKKETNTLSKARQCNGVSPNVVHSLDAAALHRTVAITNEKFGVSHFCMIHDSYGALPADLDVLAASLRHVFAEMFSVDLLSKLRDEWQAQLPDGVVLPPVPEFGSLDPRSVRSSSFFFA